MKKFLKSFCLAIFGVFLLSGAASAASCELQSLRTGVQPGNKTRLVIETSVRPSYTLSYGENQLLISISNANTKQSIKPSIASGSLVKSIVQIQNGNNLQLVANLHKSIGTIQKNQIMILEPNGDNDYRLVLDFAAGTFVAVETPGGTPVVVNTPKQTEHKHVIVIDAGHGGKDPGCIGKNGTREKDVVLSMAKKLKATLDAAGYKTYLTRSSDVFLNLDTRASIAEQYHADLFLSLHANANPSRAMKGFSIYTLSKKASDAEAEKLAEAENAADKISVDGFKGFEKDIKNTLSALQLHAVEEMSMEFALGATKMCTRAGIDPQPGPSVRRANFAVLRSTIPGALIEVGHLSNLEEERLLKTDRHQQKLVDSIVKSINDYDFDI